MAEQIMWAVKDPENGQLLGVHKHRTHAIRLFMGDHTNRMDHVEFMFEQYFAAYGYRCVQVKVSEV